MAYAYWGLHKYAEAIEEWDTASKQEGDKNYIEWAAAMDAGFRAGGWNVAERKGLESLARAAQRIGVATFILT